MFLQDEFLQQAHTNHWFPAKNAAMIETDQHYAVEIPQTRENNLCIRVKKKHVISHLLVHKFHIIPKVINFNQAIYKCMLHTPFHPLRMFSKIVSQAFSASSFKAWVDGNSCAAKATASS